jgi:hypothetical protein
MNRVLLIFISFIMASCANFDRRPSSLASSDVQSFLKTHTHSVKSASFNSTTCKATLQDFDRGLKIDWSDYPTADLILNSQNTMKLFWEARLALHQRLADMNEDCNLQTRTLFRKMRTHEDYLSEFAFKLPQQDPANLKFQDQPVPIYDRAAYPSYFVRSDLDDPKFKFQSGDLMLARGVSFISAVISQVTSNRSHFSHVVFTHEDPKTKELGTIESYVGNGVGSYKMDFALKNENARLLVLRPKDSALGVQADAKASGFAATKIPYDYTMDFVDSKAMSCLEVAMQAYGQASGGTVNTPMYPATLTLDNAKFLSQMGLKPGLQPTPDDMETDPRFDLVLDWRDYRLIRDSRHKDAVLAGLMHWLGDLHYNFQGNFKSWFAKHIVQPSRQHRALWPLVRKLPGVPNIDKQIPAKTLGVMSQLNGVAEIVLEKLRYADVKFIAATGRPMTNEQLADAIEEIRRQDLEAYESRQPKSFHNVMRPD